MKRLFGIIMVLVCVCTSYAYADGKLTAVSKNLLEYDADDNGYFYAKIENTGDAPIIVGTGKLVGFSANDDILISKNYITSNPSRILLQPGEYVYAKEYIWESVLKDDDVVDYKFSIESSKSGNEVKRIPGDITFELAGADSYDNYIYVTFTNTEDKVLYGCYVSVALYDENENIIFVDGSSYDSLGIHPGSTVTVKLSVDRNLMQHYKSHGLKPTKADTIVFITK